LFKKFSLHNQPFNKVAFFTSLLPTRVDTKFRCTKFEKKTYETSHHLAKYSARERNFVRWLLKIAKLSKFRIANFVPQASYPPYSQCEVQEQKDGEQMSNIKAIHLPILAWQRKQKSTELFNSASKQSDLKNVSGMWQLRIRWPC
jgi:hypothetical protein